jgi:acyl-homoserine-lactone acylase
MLRNPHLSWTAGYYEAHLRVPGKLDFYGDFRIGGPFSVIGGFNRYLGFATTNNANRTHEFYAFHADPTRENHFLLDGASVPLQREVVTVEYRDSTGATGSETREYWNSPYGPVVQRDASMVYIYRPAGNGEFRAGEQWLEMMKATSLHEWKQAMRMNARATSNFTYADRDGNILYVWVGTVPALPHPAGGDSLAIVATRAGQVWSHLVPFDSLPQLLNPTGGYTHQENDSPHFTNLNHVMQHESFYYWVQEPTLRMRSQHALEILHNDRKFSLEDVVAAKHSMRMLLADRVKNDLVTAVRATQPTGDVARALDLLAAWDNTVAAESRGGVLFETWWNRYRSQLERGAEPHAVPWSIDEPATTPRGLARPDVAAEAFVWAVPETARRFGGWNVAWGDVHRVRRGNVDVPVGGCGGALGCFRVLNFTNEPDGKRVANGGDGWVIAVEFGDEPRAYSVLAYGQSPNPESPWHADQAAMFAANRMKPVHWLEQDIERAVVKRYRPGEERTR